MKEFFTKELPSILFSVLLTLVAVLLILKYVPAFHPQVKIVSFDVLKLANAQRNLSIASSLNPNSDILLQLKRVGSNTQKAILEVAGTNAIVVVKQAVVSQTTVPDITDQVLKKLELSTNAPTSDLGAPPLLGELPNPKEISNKLDGMLTKPGETANKDSGVLPE